MADRRGAEQGLSGCRRETHQRSQSFLSGLPLGWSLPETQVFAVCRETIYMADNTARSRWYRRSPSPQTLSPWRGSIIHRSPAYNRSCIVRSTLAPNYQTAETAGVAAEPPVPSDGCSLSLGQRVRVRADVRQTESPSRADRKPRFRNYSGKTRFATYQ